MNFNPEIFKAYDIRGIYGRDFDEEFALRLGMALVKYSRAKKLIIARDPRQSSPELAKSLKNGIKSMGCDVIELGVVTSPLFYFAIRTLGADGGVIVTASHNPPEYNGFKVYRYEARPVGLDSGLEDLKKIITGPILEKPKYAGNESTADKIVRRYLNFVVKKSGLKPGEIRLNIGIDAEGSVKKEVEIIFEMLGAKLDDKNFDIKFKFDLDGDRLTVIDTKNQQIRGDLIAGLLALNIPDNWFKRSKLVHDLRFSRGVLEHLATRKIKLIRSRIGHTFIKEVMRKHGANLGGELSGHLYFKETGYVESAILAMLKIVKILNESGKNMNEMVKPMMAWYNSGELNFQFPISNFQKITQTLKEKYKDGKTDELDGLTVEYESWWLNLRPSNTEPVLRLVVEAKNKDLLVKKVGEIEELLNNND